MDEIGKVTHFYGKVSVAVVELKGGIRVGDRVAFKGDHTFFEQDVKSMQIEHENIEKAVAGQIIGLKVEDKVRDGDTVFKL